MGQSCGFGPKRPQWEHLKWQLHFSHIMKDSIHPCGYYFFYNMYNVTREAVTPKTTRSGIMAGRSHGLSIQDKQAANSWLSLHL